MYFLLAYDYSFIKKFPAIMVPADTSQYLQEPSIRPGPVESTLHPHT